MACGRGRREGARARLKLDSQHFGDMIHGVQFPDSGDEKGQPSEKNGSPTIAAATVQHPLAMPSMSTSRQTEKQIVLLS